jgi:hypothetical protein
MGGGEYIDPTFTKKFSCIITASKSKADPRKASNLSNAEQHKQ